MRALKKLTLSCLGYRYELFCISKSTKTTQCTLHCDLSPETAWQNNLTRQDQYSQQIFDALVMRFEAPDGRNRWDSPLFTIQSNDELPFEEITASLYERKALKPNQSTQSVWFCYIQFHLFYHYCLSHFTFFPFHSCRSLQPIFCMNLTAWPKKLSM